VANGRIRALSWFFCDTCKGRVLPHTKFDAETVAPMPGGRGGMVLLSSYNNLHPDNQIGWCLSCKHFRETYRMAEDEIWTLYLKRRGVEIRTDRLRELKLVNRKVISLNKNRFVA
jgi:hypothetical protein